MKVGSIHNSISKGPFGAFDLPHSQLEAQTGDRPATLPVARVLDDFCLWGSLGQPGLSKWEVKGAALPRALGLPPSPAD